MRPECLAGNCHHLTRPCMTIRRLRGQLGGALPISTDQSLPLIGLLAREVSPNSPNSPGSQLVGEEHQQSARGASEPRSNEELLDLSAIPRHTLGNEEADNGIPRASNDPGTTDSIPNEQNPNGRASPAGDSSGSGEATQGEADHDQALRPIVQDGK